MVERPDAFLSVKGWSVWRLVALTVVFVNSTLIPFFVAEYRKKVQGPVVSKRRTPWPGTMRGILVSAFVAKERDFGYI